MKKNAPDPTKVFEAIAWIMSQRTGRTIQLKSIKRTQHNGEEKKAG